MISARTTAESVWKQERGLFAAHHKGCGMVEVHLDQDGWVKPTILADPDRGVDYGPL